MKLPFKKEILRVFCCVEFTTRCFLHLNVHMVALVLCLSADYKHACDMIDWDICAVFGDRF